MAGRRHARLPASSHWPAAGRRESPHQPRCAPAPADRHVAPPRSALQHGTLREHLSWCGHRRLPWRGASITPCCRERWLSVTQPACAILACPPPVCTCTLFHFDVRLYPANPQRGLITVAKKTMHSKATQLLDAQIAFTIEQITGRAFAGLIEEHVDAALKDVAKLKLKDVVSADQIRTTAHFYASAIEISP